MHQLWCWINANAETITAAAAFIAALATVAYLFATILIFLQTVKSANAAKESAEAAKKSIELLDTQIKQEATRRRFAAKAGIATALEATEFWRKRIGDLLNLVGRRELPPTRNLNLPYSIAESAALIDLDDAITLSLVLDDMRTARDLIESVRHIDNPQGANNGPIERARDEAAMLLANANEELNNLSNTFDTPNS